MKRKLILPKIAFVLIFIVLLSSLPVFASSPNEIPYESYTYWQNYSGTTKKAVYSKPMYQPDFVIDAEYIKTGSFTKLSDVCADENGNIYILDSGASKIFILDKDYKYVKTIESINFQWF